MTPIEIPISSFFPRGIDAVTLWPFIFYRRAVHTDIALRCHEYFHWRQAFRWGVIPWYLAYVLLRPFYLGQPADKHPLEAPAYAKQRQVRAALNAGESIQQHLDELGITV